MGELVPVQAGRRRQAVTATAVRGLSRFAEARGIPPGREFLLDYDVIEAFCVTGLRDRTCSTRGTYRSALYRLAMPVHGEPGQRATPFAGAKAPPPYSPAERSELAAIAAAQRDPAKRASALAVGCSASAPGYGLASWWRCGATTSSGTAARQRFMSAGRPRGWCRQHGLCRPRLGAGPLRGQQFCVPSWPGPPRL